MALEHRADRRLGSVLAFDGYHRTLVLLRGAGIELTFDAAPVVRLVAIGAMAEFDGSVRTECRLLDGSCTDLNFMVSNSVRGARVGVERLAAALALDAGRNGALVFAIDGNVGINTYDGNEAELACWDVAWLPAGGAVIRPAVPNGAPLVFLAALA